jgi:uncharacterized membrane protein
MTEEQIKRRIEDYIKKTNRLLPDEFRTEDLLEDLETHIHDSLADKRRENPTAEPISLLEEVFADVGTPEEIAEEYKSEQVPDEDEPDRIDKWIRYVMRLTGAILVAVLAAWVASTIAPDIIDFGSTVIILVAFAFIEWWVRGKQTASAE